MADKLNQSAGKLNTPVAPELGRGLRALKLLVVVMGVLIVAGVIIVIVTIAGRIAEKTRISSAPAPVLAPPSPSLSAPAIASFGERQLTVPAGYRLISMSADAGRLYLLVADDAGKGSVLVLDGESGVEIGRLSLKPSP